MLFALGGLALFLMGIARISAALDAASGPVTRRMMAAATRSPLRALLTGVVVSGASQSGTATAVTILGLVASGLMAVREGIAASLGAKVGATLAIHLAAFQVTAIAWPLIGVGFVLARVRLLRSLGGLTLGVGMLFLGLDTTVAALSGATDGPTFALLLDALERQSFALALVGVALGALLSSSNAAVAIALGAYVAGALSLPAALVLVAGGNVGGLLLPVLAARSLDSAAMRVAGTHLTLKALAATALVAFAPAAADALARLGDDPARQLANAHTLFNLGVALVGTLLAGGASALAARLFPHRDDDTAPKYLRDDAVGDVALATGLALRETVRISDQVAVMTDLAAGYLASGRWDPEPIAAREAKIDRLTARVVDYLATLRATHGTDLVTERLLLVATELEHLGDQIRRLQRREQKLTETGVEFSREGRAELGDTAARVLARMRQAFTALATNDAAMANAVIEGRRDLEAWIARMRLAHLARLEARFPASRASSAHHLEVLTLWRQIDASVTRVAQWALDGHR